MKYKIEFDIDEKMFKKIIGHKDDNRIAEILGMRTIKNIRLDYCKIQEVIKKVKNKFKSSISK